MYAFNKFYQFSPNNINKQNIWLEISNLIFVRNMEFKQSLNKNWSHNFNGNYKQKWSFL